MIVKYDQSGPKINSMIELNAEAIFIAEALDNERELKGSRGPLHGIPVELKDNIETKDSMHTSAGTIALENNLANHDAFLVKKLREAGAVLLDKPTMTELANGYMESGRPFGITFASTAFSIGVLIKLAYAFEQATLHLKAPKL